MPVCGLGIAVKLVGRAEHELQVDSNKFLFDHQGHAEL